MMYRVSIRIVLHQTHDLAGAPAPVLHVIDVSVPSMQASSEAILDIIRPFAPRETGRSGAYWYRSDRGIGWLEIVGSHRIALAELDDAVRTLEITERLGEPEVYRQPQLGVYSVSSPRTTNPYTLMGVGVAMYGFAGWLVTQLVRLLDQPLIVGMLCILIATLVFVGAWVIVNGARRRSWWHRARAEAKLLGRGIPEDLRILS
ncbi:MULTISPECIES: hypothetical protein [unclassified Salinibacterium]|uniref:hypothetical protein n=1 Tax=unclassified Salinibacterium TaxID=2632331 RepID=UPI0014231FD4|nr:MULTISPECIES: hypothetical protein [unclassified Salinibacterium]